MATGAPGSGKMQRRKWKYLLEEMVLEKMDEENDANQMFARFKNTKDVCGKTLWEKLANLNNNEK